MTPLCAGADLLAREGACIPPGKWEKIPTGVWIASVDLTQIPDHTVPELQIRARSGLAFKKGITMMNGVGTIDADYRDEICVLLWNAGQESFTVQKGDRIAQLVASLAYRLPLPTGLEKRSGGFGSTGTA